MNHKFCSVVLKYALTIWGLFGIIYPGIVLWLHEEKFVHLFDDDADLTIAMITSQVVILSIFAVFVGVNKQLRLKTKELIEKQSSLDSADSIIMALALAIESRDKNTGEHCRRLVALSDKFATKLCLTDEEKNVLCRTAVLHDIGKVILPDTILLNSGKLNDDEWELMREHPDVGANLCGLMRTMSREVEVLRHHHEAWNGTGYPQGRQEEDIPYLARVFQILDIFDALSNKRSYKEALPFDEVKRIMLEETANGKCDPALIKLFFELDFAE